MTQMEARGGPRPAPGTLNQLFFDAVTKFNRTDALQVKIGGVYKSISHNEVAERVRHAARGLSSLGVRRGDRVAILAENRPEWAVADFACLTAGMTDVPIYPTLPADQIAYILKDSGAVAIFVSTKIQAEKIREIRSQLPSLKTVISFDDVPGLANISSGYAESIGTVPVNLAEVRPTIVLSVPRLYEKMYARILETALTGGFLERKIFFWARGVAERWANEKLAGKAPGGLLAKQYAVAQKLVFSKLKARTGGRLRYFVSGGAPLSPEINKFFFAAGLVILEGYGLTETSPVIAVNTPEDFRIGTVGKPIDGAEVKIAGDGEILTRGPHVMKGYYNKPDATREAIDSDGWFHTGDIGELRDGFLAITDRKKDIIVTAGGKNIAPQPLENKVKTNKYVAQAVMLGDKRKFPSMLIVPNFDQLEKWAMKRNIIWTDRAQLLRMPTIHA